MKLGELRDQLQDLGVEMTGANGHLKYTAPPGALTPDLLESMKTGKNQLIALLEAETEYGRLHRKWCDLEDAAAANENHGASDWAEKQRAEVKAIIDGPYAAARERVLALQDVELQEVAS